jgi:hypothetical protein
MGKCGNVHTTPNPNGKGWVNQVDGQVVSTHRRKDTATERGRNIARQSRGDYYIHNMDGKIGRANSYGNDPNPPKDKNR